MQNAKDYESDHIIKYNKQPSKLNFQKEKYLK